jgi:hypothetical protein
MSGGRTRQMGHTRTLARAPAASVRPGTYTG